MVSQHMFSSLYCNLEKKKGYKTGVQACFSFEFSPGLVQLASQHLYQIADYTTRLQIVFPLTEIAWYVLQVGIDYIDTPEPIMVEGLSEKE